ncbi:MAG: pyridoxal phosphate-dependent aminotransferase [Ignavibacteria bacterium]|nr:pyridoxal phosphate-dependent aminotransferase [Ignavibacteria bacterium]
MSSLSELLLNVGESRTMALSALIKKLRAEGNDVLSFTAGEPDFDTPEFIKKAAIKAIHGNFTRYTANEGSPELLKAIIEKFSKDNDLHFEQKNILVSSGAKHAIYNVLMALCNPGDEVIYQSPYWVSYPEMVKLAGARSVTIETHAEQNFKITPDLLEKAITPKTKVFLFNTPSNPTGAVYSKEEILALAEVLKKKDIFIVSDEIYEKIVFDNEKHFAIGSIEELRDKTITINGVSKAYAMTGWRIGYAAGNENVIRLARNLQSHSTSNACSISQAATVAALTQHSEEIEKMVVSFQKRRDFIVEELNRIDGIHCPLPKGAFYIFFDVGKFYGKTTNHTTIFDSSSFCDYLLKEELVGLVPGIAFGNDNCVRMSYACSYEEIFAGITRIKRAVKKLV